jgi:hypothetical protein
LSLTFFYIFRFQNNPYNWNPLPKLQGRFDYWGSSGVVGIITVYLPITGKILFVARPESFRESPNPETITNLMPVGPTGEVATLYDPVSRKFITSHLAESAFCGGAILLADGRVFISGGQF